MALRKVVPHQTAVTNFATAHHKTFLAGSGGENVHAALNDGRSWYDDGEYVLHVAEHSSPRVTCSLSNGSLRTYDVNTMTLLHTIEKASMATVTDLCVATTTDVPLVLASSSDGRVRLFDLRTSGAVVAAASSQLSPACAEFGLEHSTGEEALCLALGYGGSIVAVGGSTGAISFWDLRQSAPHKLSSYVDAHRQEITQLQFQAAGRLLLSAAQDGLVALHDTTKPTEEAALTTVMNVQSPLQSAGFLGNAAGIFCLTGSETLSFWDSQSAQRVYDFGDCRSTLSAALVPATGEEEEQEQQQQKQQQQQQAQEEPPPITFHVGCHWDTLHQRLFLLSGNANGNTLWTRVSVEANQQRLFPECHLALGHQASVRDFAWLANARVLVTGGEDGRLCAWNLQENSNQTSAMTTTTSTMLAGGRGGPERRRNHHQVKKKMNAPY